VRVRSLPAASVVIPFFNLGEYLPQTLASIERQSVAPREIIIVDDGSTEPASIELLRTLERQGRHVLVRKRNGGLGSARNEGLRRAACEWVLVLDADDIIGERFLESTLSVAAMSPVAAAIGTFMKCFVSDPSEVTGGWTPLGIDADLLASTNMACPASCLLNRDSVLAAGGYDEQLVSFEDWDLWCTFAERGLRVEIVPEFLLHYRQRSDSMYHAMAKQNEAVLRAQLLGRHPKLCSDWSRAMRVELAMRHHVESGLEASAKPLRYVVADRANAALKALGLQKIVKSAVGRVR
jgi:glycosyltransferase involved in cell wall biosynthesis